MDLGKRIRELRTARGWTATELGRRAGISRVTLSKLERGFQTDMRLSSAIAVAKALDVSVEQLVDTETPILAILTAAEIAVAKRHLGHVLEPDKEIWERGL